MAGKDYFKKFIKIELIVGNIRKRPTLIGILVACMVISIPYLVLAFYGLKKQKINLLASATGSIHNYTLVAAHILATLFLDLVIITKK